jgi:hypothetical protein
VLSDQDFLGNVEVILKSARSNNIVLRLLGSIAVRLHSETARAQVIPRALTDIDLVGYSKHQAKIQELFETLGYRADEDFNMLHGAERLVFNGNDGLRIDIFLDVFSMSHKLDLRGRLELDYPTLCLSDLLMTKLQIAEANEKDLKDVICLLHDHEIGQTDGPEMINCRYISDLCSRDWGIYRTFTLNIRRVMKYLDDLSGTEAMRVRVGEQCEVLLRTIEDAPKSMKWKMRARVGDKKRWYELPQSS